MKRNELKRVERLLKRLERFPEMNEREQIEFLTRHLPYVIEAYRWMHDELLEEFEWSERAMLLIQNVYGSILRADRRQHRLSIRVLLYLIGKPEVKKDLLILLSHLRTKRILYEKRAWLHHH